MSSNTNIPSLTSERHHSNANSYSFIGTPGKRASCNGHSAEVLEEEHSSSGHRDENDDENKNLKGMTRSLFRQVSKTINNTVSQFASTVVTKADQTTKILARRTQSFNDSKPFPSSGETNFSNLSRPGRYLSVPPSRKFTIHRVTIHRYLNKSMPSIEKYFFSEEVLDIHGQLSDKNACKRWSNISALLRIKMRLSKQVKDEEKKEKAKLQLLEQFGTKRKVETQKSAPSPMHNRLGNSYKRNPRRSSDIYSEKKRDVVSSSSSDDFSGIESLCTANILETPKEGDFLPVHIEPEETEVGKILKVWKIS